jgi:hypothetical protein
VTSTSARWAFCVGKRRASRPAAASSSGPWTPVAARSPRGSLVLKADIRPGVTDGLTGKVATVDSFLAG